jgi:hypothetical protein
MPWPIVFGVCVAVAIVAVTVGRSIHTRNASTARQAVLDTPTPAKPDMPLHEATVPMRSEGASANRGAGLHSVVAAINARRNKMHAGASIQVARIRKIATTRYAKEVRDPAWAYAQTRARAIIAKELSEAGVDLPADLATQCKRTVCKTTATFETSSQADQWVLLYMASLGDAAKSSVVSNSRDTQGTTRLDIYSISER